MAKLVSSGIDAAYILPTLAIRVSRSWACHQLVWCCTDASNTSDNLRARLWDASTLCLIFEDNKI